MRRRVIVLVLALAATFVVLGLVFAGSPTTIANGVTIAGVDVGGMKAKDARALLERKSAAVENRTVVFLAGGKRFRIRPIDLGVEPDWKAAVASAQRQGDGFGPIRALKRLDDQARKLERIASSARSAGTSHATKRPARSSFSLSKRLNAAPASSTVTKRPRTNVTSGRRAPSHFRNAISRSLVA